MDDLRVLIGLTALLIGVGVLLLCLAIADLISALCMRLWLLASPAAARRARFHAVLAACRDYVQKPLRRTG